MSLCVLIPWRDVGCPHRARALDWVRGRLVADGYQEVVVGEHSDGAWCKAAAVADALTQTQAEVVVVHDADVWCDGLQDAVSAVRDGWAWAIPHRQIGGIHRLTEASTARYMAGEPPDGLPLAEFRYDGVAGGGIVVLRRVVYEACPLDPRFRGWGGEDESWGHALRALHGPANRGSSPLIHLWHPPQQRLSRNTGSEASHALRKRYARARHRPDQIAVLVEEARSCSVPC